MELSRYLTIVFQMVIFHGVVVATYEQKKVSKLEAVQECSRSGGRLVKYKEIQDNPSAPQYLDQLENEVTAWIDGYAELSPFLLDWQGCYSKTNISNVYTFEMEERSLFLCSKGCFHHHAHTWYIGVKDTACYCITLTFPNFLPEFNTVNSSFCNISCSNNGIDSCGGNLHLDVYGIRAVGNINWGQKEPANRVCVYFRYNTFITQAYTASCHTHYIDGFVCTELDDIVLDTASCTNTTTYWINKYCFKAGPSTWQEAHNRCLAINGRLAVATDLINHTYWTSLFRSFRLSENRTSKSVCIAATNINNIIYFEPYDCSKKKHFLCRHNELIAATSVSHEQTRLAIGQVSSQSPKTSSSNWNSSIQDPGITKSDQNSSIRMGSNIGYLSLAVSVVAMAFAGSVIILFYRFKKWTKNANILHINSGLLVDSVNQIPIQCNDEDHSQVVSCRHDAVLYYKSCSPYTRHNVVPNCENRLSDAQYKHSEEEPDSQIPLAESSFVEEEHHTVELHHVYEELADDRQNVTYEVI